MLPIVPAVILAVISFSCSIFVILRIVIPILPSHPFSKRVSPAEFGLPTVQSLSPADKSHLWLAALDLVALGAFAWQGVEEYMDGSSVLRQATDPAASVRFWITSTIRQTCLLMVAFLTLAHVRMATSVSFGSKQWMLWVPTAVLVITSTTTAGVLSGVGMDTIFYGLLAYSATIAVLSSAAFISLIQTLVMIKRNLADVPRQWSVRQETRKESPRPSFGTDEIDAIGDGASWLTSEVGSRRQSLSAWSFSTHHTSTSNPCHGQPQTTQHPSASAKLTFWFGSPTSDDIQVLPPPHSAPLEPFRQEMTRYSGGMKARTDTQSSWLTSPDGSLTTLAAWSFPPSSCNSPVVTPNSDGGLLSKFSSHQDLATTLNATSRPVTPGLSSAQVLGGYGYARNGSQVEKGMTSFASQGGTMFDISWIPALGWLLMIWLPMSFALPYLMVLALHSSPSLIVEILFLLSVTLSSPLLALNLIFGSPLPIPVGLFDSNTTSPIPNDMPKIFGGFPSAPRSHEYKRSTCSVTVVESRRSGDVWIANGEAVDGKSKLGRAISLLNPTPKLSVLPPDEGDDEDIPSQSFRSDESLPVHVYGTPQSDNSAQSRRLKSSILESGGCTELSHGAVEEVVGGKVMVPGVHGPAVASSSRDPLAASTPVGASGIAGNRTSRAAFSSHVRNRSVPATNTPIRPRALLSNGIPSMSPPPSIPLPPTPPGVRATRLAMLSHKKSFSSGHSIRDNQNEIDAMTAGMLPLLVPGLKVGEDMKIKEDECSPESWSKQKAERMVNNVSEFREGSSSEVHSTPARSKQARPRKSSHKTNFSLSRLSLNRESLDILTAWGNDIRQAFEGKVTQYTAVPSRVDIRRNTILGVDAVTDTEQANSSPVRHSDTKSKKYRRSESLRMQDLKVDLPPNTETTHSLYPNGIPPSANSEMTLFEDFEAGLQSGPQAESTPHSSIARKIASSPSPPPMPNPRRSSIRDIKTVEHDTIVIAPMDELPMVPPQPSPSRRIVPNSSKLDHSPSDGRGKGGLCQLPLLQDRGNIVGASDKSTALVVPVRPLSLVKKQKPHVRSSLNENENVSPRVGSKAGKRAE